VVAVPETELDAELAALAGRSGEAATRSAERRAELRRRSRRRVLRRGAIVLLGLAAAAAGVAVARHDEDAAAIQEPAAFTPFEATALRTLPAAEERRDPRPLPPRSRIASARGYAAARLGVVSFALVDSRGRAFDMRGGHSFVSASVVKAMLLVAELDRLAASGSTLDPATRGLLDAMITYSDNAAADAIYARVGDEGLEAVARDAGLKSFTVSGYWANAQLTASDMAQLMSRLDELLGGPHFEYGSDVLARIVAAQRWGIPAAVAGQGWGVRFKGGWRGTDSGQLVHQIARLRRGETTVSLAVLTDGNPTMAYGVETIRGVAERLFSQRRAGSAADGAP
jgi:beta-lactamase class A